MEDENCTDCGEPLDGELIRVGEPFEVHCSIGSADSLGAIVLQHPETGERRVMVEGLEDYTDGDMREAYGERMAECLVNQVVYSKIMLLPVDARRFAAQLLNMADVADGHETTSGTDWDAFK